MDVLDLEARGLGAASRIAAWGCVALLVVLSWIPGEAEIRTGLPGQIEHVAAYAGTALLAALGFRAPGRQGLLGVGFGLVLLGGLLEVGQLWVPGRTAQVLDFAASSVGGMLGLAVGAVLRARWVRRGLKARPAHRRSAS